MKVSTICMFSATLPQLALNIYIISFTYIVETTKDEDMTISAKSKLGVYSTGLYVPVSLPSVTMTGLNQQPKMQIKSEICVESIGFDVPRKRRARAPLLARTEATQASAMPSSSFMPPSFFSFY